MFANAEGMSQRAPVNWSESVIGAAVCFPYVVALDEGFVTVHSMLDQQLKQTLSFRDGHILQDFEGTDLFKISLNVANVRKPESRSQNTIVFHLIALQNSLPKFDFCSRKVY